MALPNYLTSYPLGKWIKLGDGVYMVLSFSNVSTTTTLYQGIPPYHMVTHSGQYMYAIGVSLVVTSISGTSPSASITVVQTELYSYLAGILYWVNAFSTNSLSSPGTTIGASGMGFPTAIQVVLNVSGTSPSVSGYVGISLV